MYSTLKLEYQEGFQCFIIFFILRTFKKRVALYNYRVLRPTQWGVGLFHHQGGGGKRRRNYFFYSYYYFYRLQGKVCSTDYLITTVVKSNDDGVNI